MTSTATDSGFETFTPRGSSFAIGDERPAARRPPRLMITRRPSPSVDPESHRWGRFLQDGLPDYPEAQRAELRALWNELRRAVGPALPPPQVEPGESTRDLRMVWSRAEYVAEIEILAPKDGRCALLWFFRDRKGGAYLGNEEPSWHRPPAAFLGALSDAVNAVTR